MFDISLEMHIYTYLLGTMIYNFSNSASSNDFEKYILVTIYFRIHIPSFGYFFNDQ